MMIVITLTDCPISLRGDLSKWLLEINTGVFVGKVSARVRDKLWERVESSIKNGRATLVYSTNNEQHMDFRLHNSENQIIDFDGLKLVMKPSMSRTKELGERRMGFSNAAKRRMVKKKQRLLPPEDVHVQKEVYPDCYVVLDLETTGLREKFNEILEIGLLKVCDSEITASFQSILHVKKGIPRPIEALTGITTEMAENKGKDLEMIWTEVIEFIGNSCLIGHNIDFDLRFLNQAAKILNKPQIANPYYDTMKMYSEKKGISCRQSLQNICENLDTKERPTHRALQDCKAVRDVYEMLKRQ